MGWAARLAVLSVLALVTLAGPAAGHADLVSAEPRPFARLDAAPDELVLHFSERLEDRYTRVGVLDDNGTDHAVSNRIDPRTRSTVVVVLPDLPDGVYTVEWRTLSVDTHTRTGAYLLAINASFAGSEDPTTDPHAGHGTQDDPHVGVSHPSRFEAGIRWLGFLGGALAAGVPLVLFAVADLPVPGRARGRALALAAAGGMLAALAAALLAREIAGRIGGGLGDVVATESGSMLAWRGVLSGLVGVALAASLHPDLGRARSHLLGAGAVLGLGALAATSLGGHAAAATEGRTLLVAADLVHLSAVAFWFGGIVLVLAALAEPEGAGVARLVLRLSPLFVVAVGAIVVTGTVAALAHIASLDQLTTTTYGLALLAKVLLLLPLVALGAHNRYVALPRIERGTRGSARRRIKRAVTSEIAVMVLVLAAASILANNAPPANQVEGLDPPVNGNTTEPGTGMSPLEGLVHRFNASGYGFEVAVRPQPVTVGFQNVTVRVDPGEVGLPENAAVVLSLRSPSDPYGESRARELTRHGNGSTWSIEGPVFTEAGEYRVLVALQGKGTYVQDEFRLTVARR